VQIGRSFRTKNFQNIIDGKQSAEKQSAEKHWRKNKHAAADWNYDRA